MTSSRRAVLWGMVLALPTVLTVRADPDLFWHLLAGREILARRALPSHNTWSYTAHGAPWIDHEWLPETLTALAWDAGGAGGLLALRAIGILVLVGAWLVVVARRAREPVLAWFLVGVPWPLLAVLCNLRPQLVTWALVPVVLLLVDRVAEGRTAALWLVVGTVWLWANLHGGFVFGWGLAGLGLLSSAFGLEDGPAPTPAQRNQRLVAALLVALCPLVNPYGVDLLGYVARELLPAQPDGLGSGLGGFRLSAAIEFPEWQPPDRTMWIVIGAAVLTPLLLLLSSRSRVHPTAWVGLAIATFGASRHARMVALVLILSAVCSAESLGVLWTRLLALRDGDRVRRIAASFWLRLGLLASLLYLHLPLQAWPPGSIFMPRRFPVQAIDWLARAGGGGRLLVPLGWGGIALYHLHPRWQVSMDGRNTTAYPVALVDRDVRAWRSGDLDALLALKPDAALVANGGPIDRALRHRLGWQPAFVEPVATVWVREGFTLSGRAPKARDRFP